MNTIEIKNSQVKEIRKEEKITENSVLNFSIEKLTLKIKKYMIIFNKELESLGAAAGGAIRG